MSLKQVDLVAAILVMLLGIGFMVFSLPIYSIAIGAGPGAGVYPFWLGLVQVVCGVFYLSSALRSPLPGPLMDVPAQQQKAFWLTVLSILGYVAVMSATGFGPATFLVLLFHLRVVGRHSWRFSMSFALLAAAILAYCFEVLLLVPLPKGLLGW